MECDSRRLELGRFECELQVGVRHGGLYREIGRQERALDVEHMGRRRMTSEAPDANDCVN